MFKTINDLHGSFKKEKLYIKKLEEGNLFHIGLDFDVPENAQSLYVLHKNDDYDGPGIEDILAKPTFETILEYAFAGFTYGFLNKDTCETALNYRRVKSLTNLKKTIIEPEEPFLLLDHFTSKKEALSVQKYVSNVFIKVLYKDLIVWTCGGKHLRSINGDTEVLRFFSEITP